MDPVTARRLLGVAAGVDPGELRRAYRSRLLATHPDRGGSAADVAAVVEAYRVLAGAGDGPCPAPPARPAPPSTVVVTGDTVSAEVPGGDLFVLLCDVAAAVGSITGTDPGARRVEVQIRLPRYGPCSVTLALHDRAGDTTEAWCTVETLAGGPPPPPATVAEVLADGLRAVT